VESAQFDAPIYHHELHKTTVSLPPKDAGRNTGRDASGRHYAGSGHLSDIFNFLFKICNYQKKRPENNFVKD